MSSSSEPNGSGSIGGGTRQLATPPLPASIVATTSERPFRSVPASWIALTQQPRLRQIFLSIAFASARSSASDSGRCGLTSSSVFSPAIDVPEDTFSPTRAVGARFPHEAASSHRRDRGHDSCAHADPHAGTVSRHRGAPYCATCCLAKSSSAVLETATEIEVGTLTAFHSTENVRLPAAAICVYGPCSSNSRKPAPG